MSKHAHLVIRLVLIFAAAAEALSLDAVDSVYVTYLLLFILNTQLRATLLRGPVFLASLFVDLALVYALQAGGGMSSLLLAVSLMDALSTLRTEAWIFAILNLGALLYLTQSADLSLRLIGPLVYILIATLILQIRGYREQISQTELLYDENRRYSYQLEQSKRRLEEYSEKVEHLSQEEERNRISIEIHDTVGHKLTGTLMQLEAALLLLDRDYQRGLETVRAVRDNLKDSIEILRQTVKKMRMSSSPQRLGLLKELLDDFEQSTGIQVHFVVQGSPGRLYPSAELTLYKNAREALTNSARHGGAKNITVTLTYEPTEVSLLVSDDGQGSPAIHKGMGLLGMEERAAMLGGRVTVTSAEGFQVTTTLPLR